MRREVPILLTMVFGLWMIADFFVPHPVVAGPAQTLRDWTIIVIAFAYFLGAANVARANVKKVAGRGRDWPYAAALLGSMAVTIVLGVGFGVTEESGAGGRLFAAIFTHAYMPMQSTMLALLAFFVASAAFRSFRVRSLEATLLAAAALLVMIGRVPVGAALSRALRLPEPLALENLQAWIMDVPNLAAKRAILIGAALGAIATGLKIVLGIERSYLGER